MADYYLEFSEIVEHLTDPEADWLANQLQNIVMFDGAESLDGQVPSGAEDQPGTWQGPRFLLGAEDYEESPVEREFCFQFGDDDDSGRYLWLYSVESANPDQVALLVQKFLRAFRPAEVWTMTYAMTCSKPRCGAFGGGACVVTADTIEWHDAEIIADKARRVAASKLNPVS